MADDADLEVAARRIMWGKCLNSGQSCVAPDYILCSPAIQGSLAEHCKKVVKGFFGEVRRCKCRKSLEIGFSLLDCSQERLQFILILH